MEARLTGINRKETLQYLGYLGSRIPEELEADITRCEQLILTTARPHAVWRCFELLPDGSFRGTEFKPKGNDVPELLKECSGVNELIIDGYNGFLVNKKEKEFAQKMEILITDKHLHSEMSQNAVKSIEKYNSKRISLLWVEEINTILNKNGEKE